MDEFGDIIAAVQSDLNVNSNSTLFDPGTIQLAVNRAYRKCASMYKWPATRDAVKTSSLGGYEYYDYPTNWRPESIWKIKVDGVDMGDPLNMKDYYFEQENNFPSGNKTLWMSERKRFFLTINGLPPQTNGDNNIELWGLQFVSKLVNDQDNTIFSFEMSEVNEAIALEALAILRIKGGEQPVRMLKYVQGGLLLSMEAQQIIQTAWGKIVEEQAKMDRTTPAFIVPDFFPTGINRVNRKRYLIGNF